MLLYDMISVVVVNVECETVLQIGQVPMLVQDTCKKLFILLHKNYDICTVAASVGRRNQNVPYSNQCFSEGIIESRNLH